MGESSLIASKYNLKKIIKRISYLTYLRDMESPIITDIADFTPQIHSFENSYSSEVLMRLQNVYTTEVVSCGVLPRTIRVAVMARRFINMWLPTISGPQSKVIITSDNLPSTKAPSIEENSPLLQK